MKLDVVDSTETNIDGKTFTIELNSFMFDILINKGYKNKIESVIREISCNAYDAHIVAGNTQPFDVHLPSYDKKYFSLRDYGTGLSEDDIYNLYTKIGASDKRSDNDLIGAIGIGAKSIFAYVSQNSKNFTTTSFFNGTKKVYNCYIDGETQQPNVAKIHEEPTNEPNGLEVFFNVMDSDYYSFQSKAGRVYKYFDLKPNFTNVDIKLEDWRENYKKEINGHFVEQRYDSPGLLMGNVFYPIDEHEEYDCEALSLLLKNGVTFVAPIGSVDFTPFRESLEFTKKTLRYLKRESEAIIFSMSKDAKKDIDDSKCLWEAAIKTWNYSLSPILKNALALYKYKGNSIKDCKIITDEDVDYVCRHYSNARLVKVLNPIDAGFPSVIVFNDTKRGAITKSKKIKQEKNCSVYVIKDEDTLKKIGLTKDSEFVTLASSLSKPQAVRVSNQTTEAMKYSPNNFRHKWDNQTINLDDGGYYIPTYRLSILNKDDVKVDFHCFNSFYNAIKNKDNIYAFRGKLLKKVKSHKKWKSIWTLYDKTIKSYKKYEYLAEYKKHQYKMPYRLNVVSPSISVLEKFSEVDNPICKRIKDILDEINKLESELKKHSSSVDKMISLYESSNKNIEPKIFDFSFVDDLYKEYPLLRYLPRYYTTTDLDYFINYIKGEK